MDIVAGSGNDEFYTPRYAIEPLVKHINKEAKIWCPFDKPESLIAQRFLENGNSVVCSHIDEEKDFFFHNEDCDYIISNPPYSLKNEVFERLFTIGKPFAMLVGVVGLFESQKRFFLFAKNDFEIMYLNKRVSYFKSYADQKPSLNPPFSSVWLTSKILPKQINFEEIQK